MNYSNGSIIEYRTWTGETRRILVTEKHKNVKNGYSGFDGCLVDDTSFLVWGYDDQITRVVAR
jgi:hypothetical protein